MTLRKETGDRGELQATHFLLANGYEIRARNYRFGRGEVDIVAHKDDVLVFIEVKVRKNIAFGYPESFVSENQRQKIYAVAEEYIHLTNWHGDIRFDIIAIVWDGKQPVLDHFEDAF